MAASWTACWNFWRSRFELLDRQRADDRPERALEDVLDDRVDLLLGRLEEALGGVPDRLVVGADLERGDALDRDLDALAGHGVGEVHVDLAGGQLELADLVEQGQHDDALAADDLEAAPRRRPGRRPAGPDQRLVCAGDLVAAAEVGEQERDDDDGDEDDDDARVEAQEVKHPRSLRFRPGRMVRLGGRPVRRTRRSGTTIRPVPAVAVTVTAEPVAMSTAAVALNSWVWPSALTRTLPNRPAGIDTATDAARPDEVAVENGFAPSDRRSAENITNTIPKPTTPPSAADQGSRTGMELEDLGREQAADPEHRDERRAGAA